MELFPGQSLLSPRFLGGGWLNKGSQWNNQPDNMQWIDLFKETLDLPSEGRLPGSLWMTLVLSVSTSKDDFVFLINQTIDSCFSTGVLLCEVLLPMLSGYLLDGCIESVLTSFETKQLSFSQNLSFPLWGERPEGNVGELSCSRAKCLSGTARTDVMRKGEMTQKRTCLCYFKTFLDQENQYIVWILSVNTTKIVNRQIKNKTSFGGGGNEKAMVWMKPEQE